jgi:predicted nucleic acid-binding protein
VSWLLDTNVISELSRPVPEPKVVQWLTAHEDELFLSVLTLGELQKGISSLPDSKRRRRLTRWLEGEIRPWFASRLLPVDEAVSLRWGRLLAEADQPPPAVDSLIAATALTHSLTLATRNTADMARTGASLFNPWEQ